MFLYHSNYKISGNGKQNSHFYCSGSRKKATNGLMPMVLTQSRIFPRIEIITRKPYEVQDPIIIPPDLKTNTT